MDFLIFFVVEINAFSGAYPEISREGAIQKPRQLKLIDGTSFFACIRLCMALPSTCAFRYIPAFNTLIFLILG